MRQVMRLVCMPRPAGRPNDNERVYSDDEGQTHQKQRNAQVLNSNRFGHFPLLRGYSVELLRFSLGIYPSASGNSMGARCAGFTGRLSKRPDFLLREAQPTFDLLWRPERLAESPGVGAGNADSGAKPGKPILGPVALDKS